MGGVTMFETATDLADLPSLEPTNSLLSYMGTILLQLLLNSVLQTGHGFSWSCSH